jgi:hypothetical protein
MTDKYGAKKINDNPGGLIASKNCSYNDTEIVGSVMSTSLGYVDQPRPGAAAVYDAKSGAYKIKIIVDDDFDEWKKSGSFCAYYHASKAWFSSEVYSNMLRFQ